MQRLFFSLRIYAAGALIAAALLSSSALSIIPLLLLLWYLYQWRWPLSSLIGLLTDYFVFFALALLFSSFAAYYWAVLAALPTLGLIDQDLQRAALAFKFRPGRFSRNPTYLSLELLCIAISALIMALAIGHAALALSSGLVLLYLFILAIFIRLKFPRKPVREEEAQLRLLAGQKTEARTPLELLTRMGGVLRLVPSQEWVKLNTSSFSLREGAPALEYSLTPKLSGPSDLILKGSAVDRWGLIQNSFEIKLARVVVIPRARYAAWLASKYLSGTRQGNLPLLSNVASAGLLQGLRQGVEYYGNRPYQAGDSLKNIDWKHSAKFDELISKEFTEFRGQPAILLVNLIAASAEQADKLAYDILITAISLGRDNIPAALAVYDAQRVVLTTAILSSVQLVSRCLNLVKDISIQTDPLRFLNPPDVFRLRANIARLNQSGSQPARKLAELLKLEYQNISAGASHNPSSIALRQALTLVSGQAAVIVLSQRNHDAEALALNSHLLARQGGSLIQI